MGTREVSVVSSRKVAAIALVACIALGCQDQQTTSSTAASTSAKPGASTTAHATTTAATSGAPPAKPAGDAADEASITKRYPAAGDIEKGAKSSKMELKVDVNGKETNVTETEDVERTEECLAIGEKQCTKVKVSFTKYEKKKLIDGKEKPAPAPAVGKSYVVERKGDELTVTYEDGSAVPGDELGELKKMYKRFGKHKDVAAALPDKVKVGDSLDALAKVLGDEMSGSGDEGDAGRKVEAKAKVKSIREEGGKKILTIDLEMTMTGDDPKGGNIKIAAKGTVDVRADIGQPVALDMSGPIELVLPKDAGKGTGKMAEKMTASYSF